MSRFSLVSRRAGFAGVATVLTTLLSVSAVMPLTAYAAQLTSRSIQMSSSAPGATMTSYKLGFTPATNASEIIMDFCSNDPIEGDTCTATGGTNTPEITQPISVAPTVTTSTTGGACSGTTYYYVVTALNAGGAEAVASPETSIVVPTTTTTNSQAVSWAAVSGATSYRVYRGTAAGVENLYYTTSTNSYTDTCAASTTAGPPTRVLASGTSDYHTIRLIGQTLTAGTAFSYAFWGITNQSNVGTSGTFYGRIDTYAAGNSAAYVPQDAAIPTEGTNVDFGGDALSTASVVNITARVQETLSFCVYKSTCGDNPNITALGAGPNGTLNTTLANATTSFSLSTNAKNGVSVNLTGTSLTNPAHTFATAGTTTAAGVIAAGAEGFGLNIGTLGTNLTAIAPYNGTGTGSTGTYGLNTTNTTALYGDSIASLSGPTNTSISSINWAGQASNVTPAGIYTSAMDLIATGKF